MSGYPRRPIAERFWPKVDKRGPDECWEWTATRVPRGYGKIGAGGKKGQMLIAHRVSYEMHLGPIPEGMVVRHKCDNPPCVNPSHLEVGTQAENLADMRSRGRAPRIARDGERNGNAKLTVEQVREIRQTPMRLGLNQEFAQRFGVHWAYVSAIRNGGQWEGV